MSKIRIRVKRPYIGYPGSLLQNTYSEDLKHYWLLWDFKSKDDFTIVPQELPNPKPFITIEWRGSVNKTLYQLKSFTIGSRVRIKSDSKIPLKYSTSLISILKNEMKASEVIFKEEYTSDISHVNAGKTQILKADLRNADILLNLLKEHYKTSEMHDDEWNQVYDLLKRYVILLSSEDIVRNVKWSLKSLKFNNLFSYGEDNVINFEALSGLVGIFGPNKTGKSSIPGTLMYSLFNATDRGPIKNMLVCNTRKQACGGGATFSLNGKDYVIERSTTKRSNKQGDVNAATALRIWEKNDQGELIENTGEQRSDSDKTLRKLIGTAEDFHLMSITPQRDLGSMLDHGSTKRRQILSRFLDIDVLQQIHELAKDDVKELKGAIKSISTDDCVTLIKTKRNEISDHESKMEDIVQTLEVSRDELMSLRTQIALFADFKPVTEDQVQLQKDLVESIDEKLTEILLEKKTIQSSIVDIDGKISRLQTILQDYDLATMNQQLDAFKRMKSSVESMRQAFQSEQKSLDNNKRSLTILDQVPCGDEYPTCRFIKDAHELRPQIGSQTDKVTLLKQSYVDASTSLNEIDEQKLVDNVSKVEKLKERFNQLKLNKSKLELNSVKILNDEKDINIRRTFANDKLLLLQSKTIDKKNNEVSSLKSSILSFELMISSLEKENLILASRKGKIESELEKLINDQNHRNNVLQKMKYYEVIESSFSKNGIQDAILGSLLPTINEEMAKIMNGIVNFTIELYKEPDDDQIDIYIIDPDGDRRILELGSGMEKMIGSIVLRTALFNVSTLPKSDIFLIDEGFGALDDVSIEECSTLLQSLKRYFKTIVLITHIPAIKDIVDMTLEITRDGKDSKIEYL